ncbi:hypothetical protein [Paracoccus lutimaris]|uniref:hypothetical protein n=1 Tax=Paracoccus lutimaris TaxID=1490030 RepID=UPI0011C07380|nr:hypothetical protein [Paracoccus lutimaris]
MQFLRPDPIHDQARNLTPFAVDQQQDRPEIGILQRRAGLQRVLTRLAQLQILRLGPGHDPTKQIVKIGHPTPHGAKIADLIPM